MNIKIYVLTHKKIEENYDCPPYVPLLNGSTFFDDDFGYLRDDTGDNISELNNYYAELTGQYWAWKNSKADIIGFCQYRRWFVKNIGLDKLTEEDIERDLNDYDIILPVKTPCDDTLENGIKKCLINNPNYGAKWEDYLKLENIIKNKYSQYYSVYKNLMYGNIDGAYNCNMFICKKKLADEYFSWLFDILDELKNNIDFSQYPENNKRVLGFFSEYLLTVFVYAHNLKVKEYHIINIERKFPILTILNSKFPFLKSIENKIFYFKLKK
ncbi:DUF4422 domain-containing protein [Methanobrevibacter sp.]|uniref:DUF4422 domain-containing protein n=1 Tax=Methanobrevibacter sp. TaxID=66852 RepID=UPI002E7A34F2|nr:DUF4422 domain-containing protein [Methanobrevibacter sp.]MEE0025261.1 DUF4422 domain-containing protein [Methanobrevibacter sp.]